MQTFDWGRPAAGAPTTKFHLGGDEMLIECSQSNADIQQIKDNVKEFSTRTGNKNTEGGGRYMGEVPITIFLQWRREWQSNPHRDVSEDVFMALKFNSSEYSQLRDGTISVNPRERG